MKKIILTVFLSLLAACTQANDIEGRKVYECKYMANAPQDISAWAGSDMVKNGAAGLKEMMEKAYGYFQ